MNKKKKILIVEDEKPMAKALLLKLTSVGYDVDAVHNGNDALKSLKSKQYNLMLLDLVMPEKDGFAVLEELNKAKNTVPVIVSTNLSQEDDIRRAKDLGAKDYFVKSNTSITQVVEHVKKILG